MSGVAAPDRSAGRLGVPMTMVLRLLGLVFVVVLATAVVWRADVEAETGLPVGAHDLIALWSAFDVAVDGEDPYDEPTVRASETALDPRYEDGAQRFWSPPWTLIALAPVLALPFDVSVALWLVLHVVGALLCVALSWRLFVSRDRPPTLPVVLLSVGFVPLVMDALFGQLGVLIAVLILGGLWALRSGRDVVAGALFALVILKPQIAVLPLALVAMHVVALKRWRVVWSGVAVLVAVVGSSWLAFPEVWSGWSPLGGEAADIPSATIPSWLRDELPGHSSWPLVVVPLLAVVVLAAWWWRTRPQLTWSAMPAVLALSIILAPRAFVYDAVLLIPIQVQAVDAALATGRRALVGSAAIMFQAVAWWIADQPEARHQHLLIIPLVLLIIEILMRQAVRAEDRSVAGPVKSGTLTTSQMGCD